MVYFHCLAIFLGYAVLFLAVNAVQQNCGVSKASNFRAPALGHENATEGAWPWMVAITKKANSEKHGIQCSGFLIDQNHVITAAHCIDNKQLKEYQLSIGNVDIRKASNSNIESTVIKEGFSAGYYYDDIAILKLSKPVSHPDISPICLPDQTIMNLKKKTLKATMVGWENDIFATIKSPILKQQRNMELVTNTQCGRMFKKCVNERSFKRILPQGVTNDFLCARYPAEARKNQMFSGAPLMVQDKDQWYVLGFVSFGCRDPEVPEGFINVSHYLKWIKEKTGV